MKNLLMMNGSLFLVERGWERDVAQLSGYSGGWLGLRK
jgi:hypothetical protein